MLCIYFRFSSTIAFVKMLNEINDVAGQHELILESYSGQIMKEISDLIRELKEERKRVSYFHLLLSFNVDFL